MNTHFIRIVLLIGRIVAGLFYLYAGINNFSNLPKSIGFAAYKGVPMPMIAVIVASTLLVIGGVSILLGYKPQLGVAAILFFLLPVTIMMHNFWAFDDPQARLEEMRSFLSNMALAGSSLMFLGLPSPWPWSVDAFVNEAEPRSTPAPAMS
jgi:putative oxidoreductase